MMGGFGVCLCGQNARIHYCGMAENILVRSGDSRSSNADQQSTGHIQRDYLFLGERLGSVVKNSLKGVACV